MPAPRHRVSFGTSSVVVHLAGGMLALAVVFAIPSFQQVSPSTASLTAQAGGSASVIYRIRPVPASLCGNGTLDEGEACDDGEDNGTAKSTCSIRCALPNSCGDGLLNPGEEECEPERGEDGEFIVASCGVTCTAPVCEEGVCEGGCTRVIFPHACGDEPAPLPTVDPVEEPASAPSASLPSIPLADVEPLEPAVPSDDDSQSLSSEPASTELPVPPHEIRCGDGLLERGEACDDGNVVDGDGCSALCALEAAPAPRCGDGVRQSWEGCDDGVMNSDAIEDSCRTTCRLPYCGDGVTDTGEDCDDGNAEPGDGCSPDCRAKVCGNGLLEVGEECDQGDRNADGQPDACTTACLLPRCGDGKRDPAFGEECDDGAGNAFAANACRPICVLHRCGDGVRDDAEQCDDGNTLEGDGCTPECTSQEGYSCEGETPDVCAPACGDGMVAEGEECDDANTLDGDGCSALCLVEHAAAPRETATPLLNVLRAIGAVLQLFLGLFV